MTCEKIPSGLAGSPKASKQDTITGLKDNKRRYGRGAAMRESILSRALELHCRRAEAPRSLRGISRELGIEAAHILYYFGSFENLLKCLLHRWDELAATTETSMQDDGLGTLDRYVTALRRNVSAPGIVRLYFEFAAEALDSNHPAHDYFKGRFAYIQAELSAAVQNGQKRGLLRPELDPSHTAYTLIALADGLQLQALLGAPLNAGDELERAIDQLRVASS